MKINSLQQRAASGGNHAPSARGFSARGFTVVEMLIVVAIIGLLAALMFPVFARAREGARSRACLNNLRQLGMAFTQYAQDAGRKYPGPGNYQRWGNGGHWVAGINDPDDTPAVEGKLADSNFAWTGKTANIEQGALFSYARDAAIYVCPSNQDGRKKRLSYSMNCAIAGMSDVRIRQPAEIVLLVDEVHANDGFFWASNNTASTDALTQIHNSGGNLLFTDGHAKFYPTKTFTLDASAEGLANKFRDTGSPRFHDRAFGPKGSNYLAGFTMNTCLEPIPTPTPGG